MRTYFILLYLLLPIIGFSQINLSEINGEADWEKVIITRNPNDIIGLERVTTLNAESQKLYGKQSKLRKKAIEKLKKEASKQGIQIVLITLDNFSMSPINNVALEGTAYKKGNKSEIKTDTSNVKNSINLSEINGEADWEKVIITRNPNDIIGLERVTTLNAESQKLYGKQSKLRKKAIEKLKKEASKQGIQIILITLDNFSMSPINNVALEGTAYKKGNKSEIKTDTSNVKNSINLPEINGETDWEKVIITRNPNDIIGLERVTTLNTESQKLYGKQSKLRKKAIEKLKKEASKQGIQIILITLDNFSMSPINNVALEGTGYKKQG